MKRNNGENVFLEFEDLNNGPSLSWVWNIHKEADSLIHTRMQTFIALQVFLVIAYFSSFSIAIMNNFTCYYRLVIIFLGVLCCFGFYFYTRHIISGIMRLKQEYLLQMPLYKEFYGARPPSYMLFNSVCITVLILWVLLLIPIGFPSVLLGRNYIEIINV